MGLFFNDKRVKANNGEAYRSDSLTINYSAFTQNQSCAKKYLFEKKV